MLKRNAHLHIRINSSLKAVLFTKIKDDGFNSISDWISACAEKMMYTPSNDAKSLGIQSSLDIDPDIQDKFMLMMCIHYGPASIRIDQEHMYKLVLDLIDTFYVDYQITLLPMEVKKLIDIYYSGRGITPKLRQMYTDHLCSECRIPDTFPKDANPNPITDIHPDKVSPKN